MLWSSSGYHHFVRRWLHGTRCLAKPRMRLGDRHTDAIAEPLPTGQGEVQQTTAFGSVRLDSHNVIRVHGQLDDHDDDRHGEDLSGSSLLKATADDPVVQAEFAVGDEAFIESHSQMKPVSQLNYVDAQYFGDMHSSFFTEPEPSPTPAPPPPPPPPPPHPATLTSADPFPDRGDLNYVDQQIFYGGASAEEPKSSAPTSRTALDYVKQMRRNAPPEAAPRFFKSKECEVREIGQSMQYRLSKAAGVRPEAPNPAVNSLHEPENADEDARPGFGRVPAKYLPQDFDQMTSSEMETILKSCVIYNDHDIVGLAKPYGIPMMSARTDLHSIQKYLPFLSEVVGASCQLQPVHRLDKGTTGVLLLAKTKDMHQRLVQEFRKRTIQKTYWAIVNGTPEPADGIINIGLSESRIQGKYRVTIRPRYDRSLVSNKGTFRGHAWPAVTEYTTLAAYGNASLLQLMPLTGYKHQIRAHLGFGLGCPVLGDHKYSHLHGIGRPQNMHNDILNRLKVSFSRSRDLPLCLHARCLLVPGIVPGHDIRIQAGLPHFFTNIMKRLKIKPSI